MNLRPTLSLVFAAVGGYVLADVTHELLGHGATCLALGRHIALVSSVYFRGQPPHYLVDAAGPLANLLAGLGLWAYLCRPRRGNPGQVSLLLLLAMIFNLCWFAGCLLYEGLTHTGDFAFARLTANFEIGWRGLCFGLGVLAYHWLVRPAVLAAWPYALPARYRARLTAGQLLGLFYGMAGLAACMAAAWYAASRWAAVQEASYEVLGAAAPVLLLGRRLGRLAPAMAPVLEAQQESIGFLLAVGVAYAAFCLVLGRGVAVV